MTKISQPFTVKVSWPITNKECSLNNLEIIKFKLTLCLMFTICTDWVLLTQKAFFLLLSVHFTSDSTCFCLLGSILSRPIDTAVTYPAINCYISCVVAGRGGRSCPQGYFRCSTGACINITLTCDGIQHCRDASDEDERHALCPGKYYTITSQDEYLDECLACALNEVLKGTHANDTQSLA